MISNLSEFFSPEHEYYLNEISYKRLQPQASDSGSSLNCVEGLTAKLNKDGGVTVVLQRVLKFDPPAVFELEVSYGANLRFVADKKHEIEWDKLNLSKEFRDNGDFILDNLISRMTLLIGEITSSYGLIPIMLPTIMLNRIKNE